MAKYFYTVRDASGKKIVGYEDAASKEEAVSSLQSKGMVVISVAEPFEGAKLEGAYQAVSKPKYFKMHGRVKSNDLVLLSRQMATLLSAGVTVLRTVDILKKQVTSTRLLSTLNKVTKDMEAGLSLHESLAKHPKIFSDLWINLIESGEASGNLPLVLTRLASYLEKRAEFKRKIISALFYPVILLCVALGAITIFILFVIPTFQKLYQGFNITLPLPTQLLLDFSVFIRQAILFIIGGIIVLVWLFRRYVSTEHGRRQWEKFRFNLPLFGEFFQVSVIESFASEMSTLIESGVPILYALEITERSVNNKTVADIVRTIKEDVRTGKSLSNPLERSGFFSPMVVQMVTIGEEIGDLPNMFKKISIYYQEYTETFITRFAASFEPLMIVFMGAIIGTMVICMYLPIFKIASVGSGGG
ncbi:MAG: type II secretion system F family protein [Candidatus Omnitrophica bacterium]|nr:type II secretion system F family protein [Candidatus Omnitrophota bacterium]MDD5236228.1 type II secretion system F family protein [Candidatus Omnitrophota bacterium]MDD5611110.1 type II secretion system F family protein [Candidatus Omnitrophota bacterium]